MKKTSLINSLIRIQMQLAKTNPCVNERFWVLLKASGWMRRYSAYIIPSVANAYTNSRWCRCCETNLYVDPILFYPHNKRNVFQTTSPMYRMKLVRQL